jgi:hypothetical protein
MFLVTRALVTRVIRRAGTAVTGAGASGEQERACQGDCECEKGKMEAREGWFLFHRRRY